MTGKPLPWKNADSLTADFESRTFTWMRSLTEWYPARSYRDGNRKTKRVICVVTVTVYAEDPGKTIVTVPKMLPIFRSNGK